MTESESQFAVLRPSAESLHHLAAIIESSGDAIVSVGLDGAITSWNPAAESIYGFSSEEAIGRSIGTVLSPERETQLSTVMSDPERGRSLSDGSGSPDATDIRSLMRRVRKGERIPPYVVLQRRKNGDEIAVSIGIAPLVDLDGELIGAVLVIRDVTERRRLEASLRDARDRLQAVINHAPIILTALDMEGRFTLLEGKGLEAAGRRPGALIGHSFFELLQDRPDVLALYRRAFAGEAARGRGEFRGVVVDVRVQPLWDEHGVQTGVIAVALDISEQAEAQAHRDRLLTEEQRARTDAESANRLKDEFLSIAAHELKTPITGMKLYVDMMARGFALEQPDFVSQAVPVLSGYFARLERLVDDLLGLSRLSLGRLEFRTQRLDLGELLRAVVERMGAVTPDHDLRIESTPALVEADPDRIEQALVNLVSNAVKFSPDGGSIQIRLGIERSAAVVAVQDWGVGIPEERQAQIFERFYRAHEGTAHDYSGMGVGLYLSREIVRRHGGAMWFESDWGRGSTFSFSLPLATPREGGVRR